MMLYKKLKQSALFFLLLLLTACGGGSSSSDSPPSQIPTAPSVSFSPSSNRATTNTEFTLIWSSTNADSCSASGDWSGEKTTSGNETLTESDTGNKTYILSCSGTGAETSISVEIEITNDYENGQWDHTNIVYGSDDPSRQWLNIHLPYDQSTPSPIYVFAHGNGGIANGVSEKQLHTIAMAGYAVISWESIANIGDPEEAAIGVADAQVMFDWIRANADKYDLDPDHIVVGGRSRGSIISWQLAHSNHPAIKGIYMYNALPESTWQNVDVWNPVDDITIDSPITYLVYGPDFDDNDGHNPVYVDPVIERYGELGISDKITRYVDMWGDYKGGGSSGNWTNDGEIMHYFPEFAVNVEDAEIPPSSEHNTLFMGHSFFAPIARQIPFHLAELGIDNHSQHIEMSGGETGTPHALWEDEEHRNNIQTILNTGKVELLGMTASPTLEGYTLWIDYALSKNPNTKIVIGTPWLDFPANYSDSPSYESTIIDGIDSKIKVDIDELRLHYPDAEFIWLAQIYGVDLDSYKYSTGHAINLKEVTKSILNNHAYYFN